MTFLQNFSGGWSVFQNIPKSNNIKSCILTIQALDFSSMNGNSILFLSPFTKPSVWFTTHHIPPSFFGNIQKGASGCANIQNFSLVRFFPEPLHNIETTLKGSFPCFCLGNKSGVIATGVSL